MYLGIYLKDIILKTLNKYGIQSKQIYTITSDNGANMVKAISLVEETVNESENEPEYNQGTSEESTNFSEENDIELSDDENDWYML